MKKKIEKKYFIDKLILLGRIFGYFQIADIILVFSGFKSAAMIELSYFRRPGLSRQIFSKKVGDLEEIMGQLSLKFELHINYPKNKKEITRYSYIARDQKTLEKLINMSNEVNTKKRRWMIGRLLGYPKTAVGAFSTGTVIETKDLPPEVLQSEELRFLRFRLSKNWKNELKYVKRMRDEIKSITPNLYKKIKKGSL